MNLFLVHRDHTTSARMLAQADPIRARKNLLEANQLLASADILFQGSSAMRRADGSPYKLAHQHHPITQAMLVNKHQWNLARDVVMSLASCYPTHACSRSLQDWYWSSSKLCRRHNDSEDPESYVLCRSGHPQIHVSNLRDYAQIMREYCINYKGMNL